MFPDYLSVSYDCGLSNITIFHSLVYISDENISGKQNATIFDYRIEIEN